MSAVKRVYDNGIDCPTEQVQQNENKSEGAVNHTFLRIGLICGCERADVGFFNVQ